MAVVGVGGNVRPMRLAGCGRRPGTSCQSVRNTPSKGDGSSKAPVSICAVILGHLVRRRKYVYTCYVYQVPRGKGGTAVRRVSPRDTASRRGTLSCQGVLTMYGKGHNTRGSGRGSYSTRHGGTPLDIGPLGSSALSSLGCLSGNRVATSSSTVGGSLYSALGLGYSREHVPRGEGTTLATCLQIFITGRPANSVGRSYQQRLRGCRRRSPGVPCINVVLS